MNRNLITLVNEASSLIDAVRDGTSHDAAKKAVDIICAAMRMTHNDSVAQAIEAGRLVHLHVNLTEGGTYPLKRGCSITNGIIINEDDEEAACTASYFADYAYIIHNLDNAEVQYKYNPRMSYMIG